MEKLIRHVTQVIDLNKMKIKQKGVGFVVHNIIIISKTDIYTCKNDRKVICTSVLELRTQLKKGQSQGSSVFRFCFF